MTVMDKSIESSAHVKYPTEEDRPRGTGLSLVASRGTWEHGCLKASFEEIKEITQELTNLFNAASFDTEYPYLLLAYDEIPVGPKNDKQTILRVTRAHVAPTLAGVSKDV
jgi:hypothetical protein